MVISENVYIFADKDHDPFCGFVAEAVLAEPVDGQDRYKLMNRPSHPDYFLGDIVECDVCEETYKLIVKGKV